MERLGSAVELWALLPFVARRAANLPVHQAEVRSLATILLGRVELPLRGSVSRH